MNPRFLLSLAVAVAVTFAVRALPLLLFRRPIRHPFLRSFLYYVPYITLSVMTFPVILTQTGYLLSGILAMVAGIVVAWRTENLFLTAATVCLIALISDLLCEWIPSMPLF